MVYTGRGNTIFFHCGNFSRNRALALEETRLGAPDLIGTIGYIFGGTTIPLTILALSLIAMSAWSALKNRQVD